MLSLFDKYRAAMNVFTAQVEAMAQGDGLGSFFECTAVIAARRVEAVMAVWEAQRLTDLDLGGE